LQIARVERIQEQAHNTRRRPTPRPYQL